MASVEICLLFNRTFYVFSFELLLLFLKELASFHKSSSLNFPTHTARLLCASAAKYQRPSQRIKGTYLPVITLISLSVPSCKTNPIIFSEGNVLEWQKFLKLFMCLCLRGYVYVCVCILLMRYYTGQRPLVD